MIKTLQLGGATAEIRRVATELKLDGEAARLHEHLHARHDAGLHFSPDRFRVRAATIAAAATAFAQERMLLPWEAEEVLRGPCTVLPMLVRKLLAWTFETRTDLRRLIRDVHGVVAMQPAAPFPGLIPSPTYVGLDTTSVCWITLRDGVPLIRFRGFRSHEDLLGGKPLLGGAEGSRWCRDAYQLPGIAVVPRPASAPHQRRLQAERKAAGPNLVESLLARSPEQRRYAFPPRMNLEHWSFHIALGLIRALRCHAISGRAHREMRQIAVIRGCSVQDLQRYPEKLRAMQSRFAAAEERAAMAERYFRDTGAPELPELYLGYCRNAVPAAVESLVETVPETPLPSVKYRTIAARPDAALLYRLASIRFWSFSQSMLASTSQLLYRGRKVTDFDQDCDDAGRSEVHFLLEGETEPQTVWANEFARRVRRKMIPQILRLGATELPFMRRGLRAEDLTWTHGRVPVDLWSLPQSRRPQPASAQG